MPFPAVAYLKIIIGGFDVTDRFRPYLISVDVVDKETEADECTIILDDSYGQLAIPHLGESISVTMGWQGGIALEIFNGIVQDVESGFTRGEGRTLTIQGKGANLSGAGKTQMFRNWGDGKTGEIPLSQVLGDAAGAAGYAISVIPGIGNLTRKYWSQDRESFFAFSSRLAHELGGVFKVAGNLASFTSATMELNADNVEMSNVDAVWGKNIIEWRIKSIAGRPQIAQAVGEWYDPFKALWNKVEVMVPGFIPYTAEASHMVRYFSAAEADASQDTGGPSADSTVRRVMGWVLINGNPVARAGGTVTVIGARPGVDGTYRIAEAEHNWQRSSGYTTRLDLSNPRLGVGIDKRVTKMITGCVAGAPIGAVPGIIAYGNIKLSNRPRVENPDGSISTVRSISFEEDGVVILVPTVSPSGQILTTEGAIALYHRTGQFLGKFKTEADADAYAERLHKCQEEFYRGSESSQ